MSNKESLYNIAIRFTDNSCDHNCENCKANEWRGKDGSCIIYFLTRSMNCEEQILRLYEWAEDNPASRYPTWKEWQESNFSDHDVRICPGVFEKVDKCNSCKECIEREIPERIALKLNLKKEIRK